MEMVLSLIREMKTKLDSITTTKKHDRTAQKQEELRQDEVKGCKQYQRPKTVIVFDSSLRYTIYGFHVYSDFSKLLYMLGFLT